MSHGNWSSTDTIFLGPAALPFLPSWAVTNVYPLAGILVFDFLFIFCTSSRRCPVWKSGLSLEREGLGNVSWSALWSMWRWQYPDLHSGFMSCLWNPSLQTCRLVWRNLWRRENYLEGLVGRGGMVFLWIGQTKYHEFPVLKPIASVPATVSLPNKREFHFYQAFNKFKTCSLETGDTQTDAV